VRIKDVELRVGISKKNIRFYEKEGLLLPNREIENGYRDYTEDDINRLLIIKLLRKLNMPLGEIKSIVDERISLAGALKRHMVCLEEQRANLERAAHFCNVIASKGVSASEIDVFAFLEELEKHEREGAIFADFARRDTKKKYVAPVVSCICVIAFIAVMITLVFIGNRIEPIPPFGFWLIISILLIIAAGTVAALISRLGEIQRGEENDLSKF